MKKIQHDNCFNRCGHGLNSTDAASSEIRRILKHVPKSNASWAQILLKFIPYAYF